MTPYQYLAVVTSFQYCCNLKWISVRLSTFLLAACQRDELLITGSFLCVCACVRARVCVHVYFVCVCLNFKLPIALRDTKAANKKNKKKAAVFPDELMRRQKIHTNRSWVCSCKTLSAPTVHANLKPKLIVITQFKTKGGCLCCHSPWNVHLEISIWGFAPHWRVTLSPRVLA